MPSTHTHVPAADRTSLLVRSWPSAPAWASVLLVHGLGEHSGRYEHVGERFAAAGLAVSAYDHRGTGGSGGRRGHVDRWTEFHDDLAGRLADLRSRAGGRPIALYGHSMGGLIVAGFCLAGGPLPDLAVLSAPGHGEDDALVPPDSTRAFHGAPRTERRTYPGLRHELHNEPEGAAIVDEVVEWLRQQVAAAASTR